jgi:plasmid stability protein
MQYTIRNIPKDVNAALRRKAKAEGKSLNQAALEVLRRGLGVPEAGAEAPRRDLSFFSMSEEDARAIEQTHAFWDRSEIDEEKWR